MKKFLTTLLIIPFIALSSCNTSSGNNNNIPSPILKENKFPEFKSSIITIKSTKSIKTHTDYAGKGIKCVGMGDGSQKESQRPAFAVYGKTLENLTLLKPGVDGIHVYDSTSLLKGIVWDDIGEDGFTLHGTKMNIEDCFARKGDDKFGQINGPNSKKSITVEVDGLYVEDIQRVFRLNGGNNARSHDLKLILKNCHFKNCKTILKVTIGSGSVEFSNCVFEGVKSPWEGVKVTDKGGNTWIK